MNKYFLLIILSCFVAFSCNKNDDEVNYPCELNFKQTESEFGIRTYIKSGEINEQNLDFNDDEIFELTEELIMKKIILKSENKASFKFPSGDFQQAYDSLFNDVLIEYRNDSIIFSIEIIDASMTIKVGYMAKGNNSRLEFPGYVYKHVAYSGNENNSMRILIRESCLFGKKEFYNLINGLNDNDTLSVYEYNFVYEK
ncbi:MAG: hypothetical protein KAT68_02295 [Bacteroidales bacterium]|nr:hypothetical protein [Bacteroidales bacterium]